MEQSSQTLAPCYVDLPCVTWHLTNVTRMPCYTAPAWVPCVNFQAVPKCSKKTCCTFRCCHIGHARTQLMACSWEMSAGASMTVTYFGWELDGSVVKSTYAFAIVAYCVWKDCPMPQPFQSIQVRFTKYEISETDCFKTLLTQPCNIMRIEQSSAKFSWLKS